MALLPNRKDYLLAFSVAETVKNTGIGKGLIVFDQLLKSIKYTKLPLR